MAKPRFRYSHGKALAPEVALNAAVVRHLIREHYARVGGGRCDLCPAADRLQLVRRDGAPRDRSIFGDKEIINAGVIVGDELALPGTYALRCPRCTVRVAKARKKQSEARNARLLRKFRQDAEPAEVRSSVAPVAPGDEASEESRSSEVPNSAAAPPAVRGTQAFEGDDGNHPDLTEFVTENPDRAAQIRRKYGRIATVERRSKIVGGQLVHDGWRVTLADGRVADVGGARAA